MKRRKAVAVLLLIVFCASTAYSQSSSVTGVSPTTTEPPKIAFPQWVLDLRRTEIIAFGSFPFMMFFSILGMDLYRSATHDWDSRYYPWPAKGPGAIEMNTDEHLLTLGIAASGSLIFALADHLIVRYKRARAEKQRLDLPEGDVIILRRPWPPEEDAAIDADDSTASDAAGELPLDEASEGEAAP
ncbi:MAG: hypothetical protein LBK63_03555 [Treponema sp.]|jgi:hypothetical protein|nr:hypothetical protein [Treponema sp.]